MIVCLIIIAYVVLRYIKHIILLLVGWLVIHNLWFPKMMREERERSIAEATERGYRLNSLTKQMENAKSMKEVDKISQEIKNA